MMSIADVQEKLKTIPEEYLGDVYSFLELLEYKALYKNKKEHTAYSKRYPNRRAGILKDPNFWMSDDFDKPLDDFQDYM